MGKRMGNGCCSQTRRRAPQNQAPGTLSRQGPLGHLRPFHPPGRHADGNGLYLFVQPSGTRSWVRRLGIRGGRRELGLGAATLIPLVKAREQALANRMLARWGVDPLSEKHQVQGVPTFAEVAQRLLEQNRGGWRA